MLSDRFLDISPISKPILVFDGDCGFCRSWIHRWQSYLGDTVETLPIHEAVKQFPELKREKLMEAIHFIERDGSVFRGAEAVFRSFAQAKGKVGRGLLWGYRRVPGFGWGCEWIYRRIARNRIRDHRGCHWK